MGTYLEDYLDSVVLLPSEIKRHFDLMRELDKSSHQLLDGLKGTQAEFLDNAKEKVRQRYLKAESEGVDQPTEQELLQLINEDGMLEKLKTTRESVVLQLDEKVAIATQAYDLVDHHIRRLDQDLAKFESFLKQTGEYDDDKANRRKNKALQQVNATALKGRQANMNGTSSARKRADEASASLEASQLLPVQDDLPIDPNEPVYCNCRRVSYGQMVGCDNDECQFEWFHFECVGLTEQPQGKWYCPTCTAKGLADI